MPAEDAAGAFNADLLATGVVTAWLDALAKLQERLAGPLGSVHMPCDALYNALPDPLTVAPPPGSPRAATEVTAAGALTAFLASKVIYCQTLWGEASGIQYCGLTCNLPSS